MKDKVMYKIQQYKSFITTFLAQLVVLVLGVVTIKLATDLLTTQYFGVYNIVKRSISLISFPLLMGLGISVPKYISININVNKEQVNRYIFAGLIILSSNIFLFLVCLFFVNDKLYEILGLNGIYINLISVLFLSILSLNLYTFSYSILKGIGKLKIANTINIICTGIVPLISLLLFSDNINYLYYLNSFSILLTCLILFFSVREKKKYFSSFRVLNNNFKNLITFGLPRILGEFALFGLFSIPVFISAKLYNLEYTAYLSLALSLFQLFAGMLDFINVVLFSKIGILVGEGNWFKLNEQVIKILILVSVYAVISIIATWILAEPIILYFFGMSYLTSVIILKIVIFSILPYVWYVYLRNIIDIVSDFPYNTLNLVIGLIVIVIFSYFKVLNIEKSIVAGISYIGIGNLVAYKMIINKAHTK